MKVSVCSSRPILSPCGLKGIDYQVDPYIGCEHNCYYCYALPQAETDWSKEILIYDDIVDQLSKELDTIPPQTIYMGYHTDPYQPCELEIGRRTPLEPIPDRFWIPKFHPFIMFGWYYQNFHGKRYYRKVTKKHHT